MNTFFKFLTLTLLFIPFASKCMNFDGWKYPMNARLVSQKIVINTYDPIVRVREAAKPAAPIAKVAPIIQSIAKPIDKPRAKQANNVYGARVNQGNNTSYINVNGNVFEGNNITGINIHGNGLVFGDYQINQVNNKIYVNGMVFEGNNVAIIDNQIYIDGILQDTNDSTNNYSSAHSSAGLLNHEKKETKTYNPAHYSAITIDNINGAIDVIGDEHASSINLSISKRAKTEADLNNIITQIDEVGVGLLKIKTIYLKPNLQASVSYKLRVPKNKELVFKLHNASGDIQANDLAGETEVQTETGNATLKEIKGSAFVNTGSGDIKVSNIEKNLNARSENGSIRAKNVKGNSDIETSNGDINVDCGGSFNGKTTNGSIRLEKDTINAPITIKNTSGDITISARTMDANLTAQTISGDFKCDFPIAMSKQKSWGQKTIVAPLGKGGPQITVSTTNGNIKLKKH